MSNIVKLRVSDRMRAQAERRVKHAKVILATSESLMSFNNLTSLTHEEFHRAMNLLEVLRLSSKALAEEVLKTSLRNQKLFLLMIRKEFK